MPSDQSQSVLRDERILVTGATGLVATPIVKALAADNDVVALARLRDPGALEKLRTLGAKPLPFDLGSGDYEEIPDDFTVVLNFAVDRSDDNDFDRQMKISAEATGLLMARCAGARSFLQCSSNAVYQAAGDRSVTEDDELGDHHRVQYPTYSIGRIVAEGVARAGARIFNLPTVIARLTVPYGSVWGYPSRHLRQIMEGQSVLLHPDDPQWYTPLHERDIVGTIGALVNTASVPANIVNWAGDEQVRLKEWCIYIGELLGTSPAFEVSEKAFRGVRVNSTKRHQITGPVTVRWREGIAEMVKAAQADH
jgi:UDP-glucuronate 4-epimerase